MVSLTITRISRKDKDKDGKPYINKDGKPYVRLGLQAKEYGNKWISFFGNKGNENWSAGDVVKVLAVEENGQYLNGKMLPRTVTMEAFEELEARVKKLESILNVSDGSSMETQDEFGY